jgi:hypothetical protein
MEQVSSLSAGLELIGATSVIDTSRCLVGKYLDSLDETSREESISLLEKNSGYSTETLFNALKAVGYSIGATTIRRHRIGACACQNH